MGYRAHARNVGTACVLSAAFAASLLAGCANAGLQAPSPSLLQPQSSTMADAPSAPDPTYRNAVIATKPTAFFPFDSTSQGSIVGGYKSKFIGGASISRGRAPINESNNNSLFLRGAGQYVTTTLSGGIPGKGSMIAWVNLATLPSKTGRFFYVCGESQGGNDFDVQFETDNQLRFYTGGGENTSYAPPVSSLVGKWHMIAVTYSGGAGGFRDIYWDGRLAASFKGGVNAAAKTQPFSVGASTVFGGRFFQGHIDEVAALGRALSSQQVRNIFAASK